MDERQFLREVKEEEFFSEHEITTEEFPHLDNISSAFFYQFLPRETTRTNPEFVYIRHTAEEMENHNLAIEKEVAISEWNLAWEAGQLRYDILNEKLPLSLQWLSRYQDQNIYLLPRFSFHRFEAFSPILLLLPWQICKKFGLPYLKRGLWPPLMTHWYYDKILPKDFDLRLSKAFAHHIWRHLISGSPLKAFSMNDPIVILAHNLDFWLPYVYQIAEKRLMKYPRVKIENKKQLSTLQKARKALPHGIEINRPYMGGTIWMGTEEAEDVTREVLEVADSRGKLRDIVDAVRTNRVEDDFSDKWSYAKEDFERKLYCKRSKIKVTFVELGDTIPIQGPESEVEGNLVCEDFLALLNKKEKNVVVCLRNGITRVGEISKELGYANHSPVSKALKRIRMKAEKYFNS